MSHRPTTALVLTLLCACSSSSEHRVEPASPSPLQSEVQRYLDGYNAEFVKLYTASNEAQWVSNTHIVEGDETNAKRTRAADEALAVFTGSVANIETSKKYLAQKSELTDLQVRELEKVLFRAGGNPATVADVVKARIAAETAQTEKLYGFQFTLDGKEITPNQIDDGLRDDKDLAQRLKVWEASKEVGKVLRPGLIELRKLRNECVQALGYEDFFAYMASEYGMTTQELAANIAQINRELRPLFRELHTWARYEL